MSYIYDLNPIPVLSDFIGLGSGLLIPGAPDCGGWRFSVVLSSTHKMPMDLSFPAPTWDNQKYFQVLPNVPREEGGTS